MQKDALYTAEQVQALDHCAIHKHGIAGFTLMTRAAQAVVRLLRFRWPGARRVAIVCGAGNNGGDGFVVARLLAEQGFNVSVAACGKAAATSSDARRACDEFIAAGGAMLSVADCLENCDVIVDALFGSGLSRPVVGEYANIIREINACAVSTVAVDTPSGICCDSGAVLGVAVRADVTMTFIGRKRGLYTAAGPDYSGAVFFDSLGVPETVYRSQQSATHRVCNFLQLTQPAKRAQAAHKGSCGRVLCIGGNQGYRGAVELAALSCLRVGAGSVTVAVHPANSSHPLLAPELMTFSADPSQAGTAALNTFGVIVIGPGLGRDQWARDTFVAALCTDKPLVLDADALNLLGESPVPLRVPAVLTPHPAEAGRLLGISTADVQANRFAAVEKIAHRYNAVVVLKGNGTLVTAGEGFSIIDAGNSAMATAGMGDVLAGMVAGFIGQGMAVEQAALFATTLHAQAGDKAAQQCGNSVIASDVVVSATQLLSSLR